MSSIKEFEVFTGDQQLDLIRVVDHLVCGYRPNDTFTASTRAIPLQDILQLSFKLAATCTNYCYPDEATIEKEITANIDDLADFSTAMGASSIVIPLASPELNEVFERAIERINAEHGREVAILATAPHTMILSERSDYNSKKSQSIFTDGVRGKWALQSASTREIA